LRLKKLRELPARRLSALRKSAERPKRLKKPDRKLRLRQSVRDRRQRRLRDSTVKPQRRLRDSKPQKQWRS